MEIRTREEVSSRVFMLRQELSVINKEFDDSKVAVLLGLGPKPSIFRPSLRKSWGQLKSNQMAKLTELYNSNPTVQELRELQANCPHDFTPWSATQMGPELIEAFQSRHCQICAKREMQMDSYGGCGIG